MVTLQMFTLEDLLIKEPFFTKGSTLKRFIQSNFAGNSYRCMTSKVTIEFRKEKSTLEITGS